MEPYLEKYSDKEIREIRSIQNEHSFMGHPKMMGPLSILQLIGQFVSWSVNGILIYYLYATVADGGLGLTQTEAVQLTALYNPLITLAAIIGSIVCDKILGPRKSMRYSRFLGVLIYGLLAFAGRPGYYAYLALGVINSCIAGQAFNVLISRLYAEGDNRKDAAFSLMYVISNIGAAVPFLAGTLADAFGYHMVFGAGAVLVLISNGTYLLTERKFFGPIGLYPDDPMSEDRRRAFTVKLLVGIVAIGAAFGVSFITGVLSISSFASVVSGVSLVIPVVYFVYIVTSKKTKPEERTHVLWLLPAFIANVLAMLVWTQSTTILAVYADTTVDRVILGFEITPAFFGTLGGLFAIIYGSVVTALWTRLGNKQPSPSTKIGIGTMLWALGPVFMCLPFLLYPAGVKVSPLWLVGFYAIIILGEAFANPVGTSITTSVAPAAFGSQMLTVWAMGMSTGSALTSVAANFYHEGGEVPYFLAIGGVTFIVGLLCTLFARQCDHGMGLDVKALNTVTDDVPATEGPASDVISIELGEAPTEFKDSTSSRDGND